MVPRYDYWYAAHKQEEDETTRVKSEDDEGRGPFSTYPDDDDFPSTKMGPYSDHPFPSSFPSPWPSSWLPPPYGPQTTSSPSATDVPSPSSDQSALPENTSAPSPTPTVAGSKGYPNPSGTGADDNGNPYGSQKKQHSSNSAVYAAAAIIPVVLIVLGLAAFFYLRKRKRQNRFAATPAQIREMKMSNQPTVQAYVAAPPPLPREPSYTAPPSHPPPPSPTSPAPVILGPITSGSSGNYMTGIDTSDVVSVRNERTGLGDPFADGNSLNEEPPPPYRPRSIAPLSRDTSLRVPPTDPDASSRINLIDSQGQPLRSPFDDPEDDDVVSDISGPTARRNQDNMSVVSDLSYQHDPVVNRPTV